MLLSHTFTMPGSHVASLVKFCQVVFGVGGDSVTLGQMDGDIHNIPITKGWG